MINLRCTTLLPLLFLSSILWPADKESTISKIKIEGPKRSGDAYILRVINVEVGDTWSPGMEEDIRHELLAEGVFIRETLAVSSEEEGGKRALHIFVEDRWTLIPAPMINVSSDSWMAGLMLVERNFLGKGIFATVGFGYGSDIMNAVAILGFENLVIGGGYKKSEKEEFTITNAEPRVLRTYTMDSPYAFLRPKVELGDWILGWDFQYTGAYISDISSVPQVQDPEGGNYFSTGPVITYKGVTYKSIYEPGPQAQLTINYITPNYGLLYGEFSWGFLPGKSTFFSLTTGGGWGQMPDAKIFTIGRGMKGSRTLPSITTKAYVHGTAEVEQILFPIGTMNVTGYLFYEVGVFHDLLEKNVFYHGPGIGMALHMDAIAIPTLGIGVSWSVPLAAPYLTMSFGMSR
ncbi:MAG: hypothetical protein KAH21_04420 [Spirochaetaceae bacterium]|nr:hypothetical protein [Spirochaetaceae bacterium]